MSVIQVKNGITMHQFTSIIKQYPNLPNPLIVYDIGSRDGQDARQMHHSLPNTVTYAFEAHPFEYAIHKNANADINWINMAIYDRDGEIAFYPKSIGSGIHSIRDRGSEFGTGQMLVPCQKMATFLRENGLNAPHVVKVDVEGCSLEVLKSFDEYINDVLFFHMESEEEQYFSGQFLQDTVFSYLEAKGFVKVMYSTTEGSNQHDSVWVSSKIHK